MWLTQAQLSELFQRERSVITKHIRNLFVEGELVEWAVGANFARTATDGKTYQTVYFNLDVIISMGHRALLHVIRQLLAWIAALIAPRNAIPPLRSRLFPDHDDTTATHA